MKNATNQRQFKRSLECVLLSEIIPSLSKRLAASSSDQPCQMSGQTSNQVLSSSFSSQGQGIEQFSRVLLENDHDGAYAIVQQQFKKGVTTQSLILEFLGGSANLLGEKWCKDMCSFGDVTLGLSLLHQLLHELTPRLAKEVPTRASGEKILFAATPGDTHIFSVCVLEAFFNASGWQAEAMFDVSVEEITEKVNSERPEIVGISVSCDYDVKTCGTLIKSLKSDKRKANPKIIVGGAAFAGDRHVAKKIGADSFAENAIQALDLAMALCNGRVSHDVDI